MTVNTFKQLFLSLTLLSLFVTLFISVTSSYAASITVTSNNCTTVVGKAALPTGTLKGCNTSGGGNSTGGGSGGGSGGGPCQTAPPPPADIRGAIISKWGITLNLPANQLGYAWEEFHEIDCVGLLQDIRGSLVEGWGNAYSQQFSCPSDPAVDLYIGNFTGDWMKVHLAHELTHIWQFCSQRGEANRLEIPNVYAAEGGLTNYSRTRCGFDINVHYEDHAETISLFLNPESGETTCAGGRGNPYSGGKYPLHRGVAERGVGRK